MPISRDACLQALQEAADELGHAPTIEEYKALDVSPSYNTIIARYGTWLEALDHVDADRKSAVRYSREDCIEALQAAAEELGEEPTMERYDRTGRSPAATIIAKRFDTWETAKEEAGVTDFSTSDDS
jgi:phosphoglycolate phosphatase-like HAD superfamily hydrolase